MPTRIIVPLIVACALIMQQLDSTALATALPAMAESFGVPPLRLHLAITAYLLALAGFLPISGWVADRFGAKLVFRVAIGIFTVSSLFCGLSDDLTTLVLARVVQGFGGAMMVPVGRLILIRSVTKAELVGALALMGMPALVGPVLGPVLGGFLTTYASWRWIFLINLPIGIVGIVLVTRYIVETRESYVRRFDLLGFVLSGFGLTASLFGLDALSSTSGLDWFPGACLASGLLALVAYGFHSRRVEHPILAFSLFRFQTFRISIVAGILFRIGVGALPFLMPLLMQEGFGMSPFNSGLVTFMSAAGSFGMRTVAKRVLRRFGFRPVLVWNALIASGLTGLCAAFQPSTPIVVIMAILFFGGVFRSLEFTAINAIGFAEVEGPEMSQATTWQQMSQRLSQTIGIGMSAFVLHWMSGGGATIPFHAFTVAFVVVAALSAVSVFWMIPLAPDVGEVLAGRAVEKRAAPAA